MNGETENEFSPTPSQDSKEFTNPRFSNQPKIKFSIVDKWKEIMSSIKEKTGIDGIYVVIFLSICVLFVYLGIFGSLITSLVGTLYPGFCTIKAIQKKENKKDWLTYWVIFGSFLIFDMFSNIIMKFIPFYFVLKILFLIWMFIPGSNGCKLVYDFLITKILKPLEQIFDIFFHEAKMLNDELMKNAKKGGVKIMKDLMDIKKKIQRRGGNQQNENNPEENDSNFKNQKSVLVRSNLSNTFKLEEEEEKKEENKEEKKEEKKEEIIDNKKEERGNEEKKKEEQENEEHINLNKDIDEYRKTLINNSKEEKKEEENGELNLSFNEE